VKKTLLIFLLLFFVAVFVFLYYFKLEINTPVESSAGKTEIKISDGQLLETTIENLKNKKLLKSAWSFYFYLRFKKVSIKSGDYLIPGNITEIELAEILSKANHQVIKITIPEGWRREQIAQYLSVHTEINPEEFLAATAGMEGKLFPDTYNLSDEPTVDEVVSKMTIDYQKRTDGLAVNDDVLAIASIVEREAANDTDRAAIAGVFINREKIGMKFESDVTVQFQKDNNNYQTLGVLNYKFWKALESGDTKKILGSYNTYLNAGIPGPICNPGLASIKATLSPESHNYYYFIYDNDDNLHLAKTQAEQLANVNKYLY
jgi:UPF0755 protein